MSVRNALLSVRNGNERQKCAFLTRNALYVAQYVSLLVAGNNLRPLVEAVGVDIFCIPAAGSF